jgi:hypothetical protein
MRITRRYGIPLGVALAVAIGGVGAAVAGSRDDDDKQVTGPSADRARQAAGAAVPGGRVTGVERDSDDGASWEVEVVRSDGKIVDIELDRNYRVTARDVDEADRGPARDDERGDDERSDDSD